jgi:hypothetical protein
MRVFGKDITTSRRNSGDKRDAAANPESMKNDYAVERNDAILNEDV